MIYFRPNRNYAILVLVIVLVAAFASPVAAQDALTPTIPGGSDDGMPLTQLLLFGVVVLAFGYAAYENRSNRKLHLEAIDRLYKSAPPFIRQPAYDLVSGTSDNVINELDRLAQGTTWTDLDDRAVAEGRRILNEAKARWEQLRTGNADPLFPPQG